MKDISLNVVRAVVVAGLFIIAMFAGLYFQSLAPAFYVIALLLLLYLFLFAVVAGRHIDSLVETLLQNSKNEMQNRHASELENLRALINIKVKAKTESLQETINALEQKVKNRTLELLRLIEKNNAGTT